MPILGHPDLTPLLAETLSKKRGIAYIDDGQFRVGQSGSMVPQGAIMGVLSSGSTDLPKLLFGLMKAGLISFLSSAAFLASRGIPLPLRKEA